MDPIFSISTSWNSHKHITGAGIIEEIRSIGFDTVELNFALTKKIVDEIKVLKDASVVKISSVHNMCPLPEEITPDMASPDHYSLASPDDSERSLAVRAARNTIEYAACLGARAVVLHAGRVAIKDRTRELASAAENKEVFERLKADIVRERGEKSALHLDSALRSIDELVPYARRCGVKIGIENRYYYREIPIFSEFENIFSRFDPADVYYWHDTGHAEVFERLGLTKHADLLKNYGHRLLGVHLHDIIGRMDDHHPPGTGEFDFRMVAPFIKNDTIKVIEAHQPSAPADIVRSAKYLHKIFG